MKNSIEIPQTIKHVEQHKPESANLFEMSPEQILKLEKRVLDSKGIIRIFIHPYYSELPDDPPTKVTPSRDHKAQYNTMLSGFEKLLVSDSKNVPPIFVFEETVKMKSTISKIKDFAHQDVYYVPTAEEAAAPLIPEDKKPQLQIEYGYVPQGWRYTTDLLKKIGVTDIVLGGRNFNLSPYKQGTLMSLDSCVGNAYSILQLDFRIKFSMFTYPNRIKDHKRTI